MNYMLNIALSLGLLVLTLASSWSWGKLLFSRLLNDNWSRAEKFILEISLGLGTVSYSLFALSLLGLLYRSALFAILFLPCLLICLGKRRFIRLPSGFLSTPLKFNSSTRPLFCLFVLIILVFIVNLVCSFTPPYAGDAIGYHLSPPRAYLRAHKLIWLEGNVLASQPAAVDMLFTIGFAGGSEFYPNVLHCIIGLMIAGAIYAFGRRYFGKAPAALGAFIFYLIPSVTRISSWAYIDLGLSLWVWLAIFAFLKWRKEGGGSDLILSAIFAGLAMGSKYTGLVFFALLAFLALRECLVSKERRRFFGRVCIWAGLALTVAAPWYLKNLWMTGNPFYPLLYSIFGGRGWDAVRAANFRSVLTGGMKKGLMNYLLLPWSLTVRGAYTYYDFDGIIGPAFLLFLPLLIFVKKKNYCFRFLGIYSALYFVAWALISLRVRKLIPALAPASLLAGVAVANLLEGKYSKVLKVLILMILVFVILVNIKTIVNDAVAVDPVPVITGKESKEEFLTRKVYNYRAIDFLNRNLSPGAKILFVYGGNAWYYSLHDTVVDSVFQDHTLKQFLKKSDSIADLTACFEASKISHILINFEIAQVGLYPELSPAKKKLLDSFLKEKNPPHLPGGAELCAGSPAKDRG